MKRKLSEYLDDKLLIVCPNCEHELIADVGQFVLNLTSTATLGQLQKSLRCSKCKHKGPQIDIWKS